MKFTYICGETDISLYWYQYVTPNNFPKVEVISEHNLLKKERLISSITVNTENFRNFNFNHGKCQVAAFNIVSSHI